LQQLRGCARAQDGLRRAFGDIEYKHLKESAWAIDNVLDPVTAEPTVKSVELGEGDEFVVFGSDGLFDGLSCHVNGCVSGQDHKLKNLLASKGLRRVITLRTRHDIWNAAFVNDSWVGTYSRP